MKVTKQFRSDHGLPQPTSDHFKSDANVWDSIRDIGLGCSFPVIPKSTSEDITIQIYGRIEP